MGRKAGMLMGGVALVVATALTGCANPVESILEEVTGGEVTTDGDGVTFESENGSVQVGGGTELPVDFPGELPTPPGKLVAVVSGGGGWTLSYEGVDRGAVEQLESALTSSGFAELTRMVQSSAIHSSYQSDKWMTTLIWDGSDGGSRALIYGIVSR